MRHIELQRRSAGRVKQMRRKMAAGREKAIFERDDLVNFDWLLRHAQLSKLLD
jgi:hypothetical protein